ncbi:MAG: acetoacetate decarboxylase family protein [Sneathiellaceae bacterium]
MGFVKTPEEVARIQAVLSAPRFVGAEMLSIDFLTRPEIVAAILPPGLEPASEPLVTAMVGRWRSNCVADFTGGAIYVMARHGEIEAPYVLSMYMDQDHAIIFGRDLFGEPKKHAHTTLQRRGGFMHGFVDRGGARLIEIKAELGADLGAGTAEGANFNIKATPSCTGIGLEDDPVLTLAAFRNSLTVQRRGQGSLALGSTAHDPLADLEIVELRGAAYLEGDLICTCRPLARLDAAGFVPYLYGRLDDWSALDTENVQTLYPQNA